MRSPLHFTGTQPTQISLNLILFSSLLMSSLVWPALSAEPRPDDCEPRHCGDGLNISYPFWIQGQQPRDCGYPAFKLSCRGGSPFITIYDDDYFVRRVFYDNQSFILSSIDFFSGSCPVPRHNLSLGNTPFSLNPTNRNLSFLLNCTEDVPGYQIGCAADGQGKKSFIGNHSSDQQNAARNCESVVFWPSVDNGSAENDRNYAVLLENGFLLLWDAVNCVVCKASGGRCRYNLTESRFACVCSDRSHAISCNSSTSAEGIGSASKTKIILDIGGARKIKIILGISAGTSGFLLTCILLCRWLYKKRSSLSPVWIIKSKNSQNVEAFLKQYGTIIPKRYGYAEVKKMTKSFTEKLGQGGYGTVFKGKLLDGRLVAVKVFKSKESAEEFINEVASIGRTHHINIVRLLGFCCEGPKRALLYEFMPNGSLEKFVSLRKPETVIHLGWEKLLEIVIGIARGLEYLHRGCNARIVHFDIKPHNILLDEDFCPKISDFGLAKSCRPKQSILSTVGARGTIGYIAPEVFSRSFGVISGKADVYSYGMMVLEMVGGRTNIDVRTNNTSDSYFPHWIYDHFNDSVLQLHGITNETEEVARKLILVGLWCIQTSPSSRPSISKALEMLEGNFEDLQVPPKPYLCSP